MKVIKNVISPLYADKIEELMSNVQFQWGFLKDVTYVDQAAFGANRGTPGFAHLFFDAENGHQSDHCNFVLPLFYTLCGDGFHELIRIKGGLLLPTQEGYNNKHVDFDFPHTTALYYVNDSDGDTLFFNDNLEIVNRVKPEKGKLIIFDGSILHASSCPTSHTNRIVINFNYVK
tara:strand:- start:409 stop:930 length:522 start_codon:yes stop_codon:yes gene_type:complete